LLEGISLIRADEGRHLTHGMEYLRTTIAQRPQFAAEVQRLFSEKGGKIPARTQFTFELNDFQLDQNHMLAIAYAHLAQRTREAGLGN
jgi:hypothetical protein